MGIIRQALLCTDLECTLNSFVVSEKVNVLIFVYHNTVLLRFNITFLCSLNESVVGKPEIQICSLRSNNVSPAGASAAIAAAPSSSSSFAEDGDSQWAERDFQSVYETAHREEVGTF